MNIIQTLHMYNGASLLRDNGGWYAPEYHLMSWALSCLQIKKYYDKIQLYSDAQCAEVLVNLLQLPYDRVKTLPDNFSLPHKDLWALPKIYTYSLQEEPFLHIDGDVFIFRAFSPKLLQQSLIAQNEEEATEYYTSMQKLLIRNFKYFPEPVKEDFDSNKPIHAVNAGILGGKDIAFFKRYTKMAMEYIYRNKDCLSLINVHKFNIFFEQHLFYCLAKKCQKKISFLMPAVIGDHQFSGLGNFYEVPFNRTYLHLIGEYKRNKETCLQLANKLRANYPDYYYKIISLFKRKKMPLRHEYYNLKSYSINSLKHFSVKSKKDYLRNKVWESDPENTDNRNTISRLIDDTNENRCIARLIKETADYSCERDKEELRTSFRGFISRLCGILQKDSCISRSYLNGRDMDSEGWYRFLFRDNHKVPKRIIIKNGENDLIDSKYNWGTIWCGLGNIGVPYYKKLEVEKGEFVSLVIPEAYENGFTIFDLEPMEVVLLDQLSSPQSICDVIHGTYEYFEPDVVKNYPDKIHVLILTLLKQLVLRKAIKPYK